jgi:polyisoprenoid-binding protein YceI
MPRSFKFLTATSLTAAVVLAACSNLPDAASSAVRAYQVDTAQSSVQFVTTKAGQPGVGGISEVQSFKRYSGGMTADGQVSFDIDLASVDTGVGIRDERLRNMLFMVQATPQARFTAQLDPAVARALAATAFSDIDVKGNLVLAGQTRPVDAKLRVTRLAGGALQVATRAPIVVDANQYGMKAGVEALRDVMGLNFLASVAPVNFTLVLNAQR